MRARFLGASQVLSVGGGMRILRCCVTCVAAGLMMAACSAGPANILASGQGLAATNAGDQRQADQKNPPKSLSSDVLAAIALERVTGRQRTSF